MGTYYVTSTYDTTGHAGTLLDPWGWSDLKAQVAAGDTALVMADGTYSCGTGNVFAGAGTAAACIVLRGADASGNPITVARANGFGPIDTSNMPLLQFSNGNPSITIPAYTVLDGLQLQCAGSTGRLVVCPGTAVAQSCVFRLYSTSSGSTVVFSSGAHLINCDVIHTGTNGGSVATNVQSATSWLIGCRLTSPNGTCVSIASNQSALLSSCVLADCVYGVTLGANGIQAIHAVGNTFYDCSSAAIYQDNHATSTVSIVANNIFASCGVALANDYTADLPMVRFLNAYYNCGTDAVGGVYGAMPEYGAITLPSDPFIDAANGDFRLVAGTGAVGAGFPPGMDVGAVQRAENYPAVDDVEDGVLYGQADEFEGTLVAGGGVTGAATLAKETGANARGGSGTCAKLTPTSASAYGYWHFYVPVTASTEFTLSFYHKIASSWNGVLKVSIYDTDNATPLLTSEAVTLTDDGAYHQYTATPVTPTATGLCRVRVEIKDGASTGYVFIDDVAVA